MKHIIFASNISIFLKFSYSVDKYQPPQWSRNVFWTGREAEDTKYKFRFAPKLPSICINQKY